MKKRYFVLELVVFSSKSLNLVYIQQISPQFIYFISVSTCGEFQICGEFYIPYSNLSLLLVLDNLLSFLLRVGNSSMLFSELPGCGKVMFLFFLQLYNEIL